MADSFQPRFVDLVRNYTDTVGTGNLELGAAVAGYASFTDALTAGDRFYYSVIAVEGPQTEVGRGTLQADGSIVREPIGGVLTDFPSGTKTVALVAAAEWFEQVQAGTASEVQAIENRGSLALLDELAKPAMLYEQGREGVFLFNPSDLSVRVTSDPQQGVYVASASDPSGSSGAWVRSYSGPIEVRWFGATGDGMTDDSVAVQAALTFLESGGGELRMGEGHFVVGGTLMMLGDDLSVDARGATVVSFDPASMPMVYIGGARTKILGGTWKIASGIGSARPFDIEGVDCTLDGATLLKEPETDGVQAYVRPTADGFTMRNCTTRGSNGIQLEASNSAILMNRLQAVPTGGDDAIAIKAINKITRNIRIIGNSFENHAYFCSIGSQIGSAAADDPQYSYGVFNVVVEGNTGRTCAGMLYIKPGAISGAAGTGYDYRDGTVRQVVCSNNVLRDEKGQKFSRSIVLTPSRGGRIIGVRGSNNIIEARTTGNSGDLIGGLDCFVVRNSTDGSAPSFIEDVDVEVSFNDPYDGAANSAAAPGYPVNSFAKFDLSDPGYGTMRDIALSITGNGCAYAGIHVGKNLDGAVTIRRAKLSNVNSLGSNSYGGIQTSSRLGVGTEVSIDVIAGYPYQLIAGTSADVQCPPLEREALMPTVPAGVTDSQFPHSAPGRCQIIEMLESVTADIAASDSIYTNIQFRNKGGTNVPFHGVYTKLTPTGDPSVVTTGFTAGSWSSIFKLRDITSANNLAQTMFSPAAVLHHHKYAGNEGGGGRALANPRLKVRWAPY